MQDGYWGLINVSTEIMTNQELQSRAIELSGIEAVILYFITISITVLVCVATYWIRSNVKLTAVLFLGTRTNRE